MIVFFKSYIKSLLIFRKYLGNQIFLTYLMVVISGIAEGLGIMMLIPLISNIANVNSTQDLKGINEILLGIIKFFGFEESVSSVLVFILISFLIKGIIFFLALAFNAYLRGKLLKTLKIKTFNSYNKMKYSYYLNTDTGHLINIINEQTNRSLEALRYLIQTGSLIIISSIYIILAALVSWSFFILAIISGIIVTSLFGKLNKYVREQSRKISYENSYLSKVLIQSIQSLKYLRATGQTGYSKRNIDRSLSKLITYQINAGVANALTTSVKEPIAAIFVISIIFLQFVVRGQPITPILVSILLFYRGLNGILGIQGWWQTTMEYIGSIDMIDNELNKKEFTIEETGPIKLLDFKDLVEFKNVSFSYSNRKKNILKDINLRIKAKTSIAIVGESGAGKSTLVDLMTLCSRPSSGKILIDGEESRLINNESWRKKIGYVPQETNLFDDTIANNIAMCDIEENSNKAQITEKIKKCAKDANIENFISNLESGYKTFVGDRGIKLSGGQRQRIAIARELFRSPKILIMDEATSSLDSLSENEIKKSIDNLKGKTTLILIAHRLSTIKDVDKIFVLKDGCLVEEGDFNTLYNNKKSIFSKYFDINFKN